MDQCLRTSQVCVVKGSRHFALVKVARVARVRKQVMPKHWEVQPSLFSFPLIVGLEANDETWMFCFPHGTQAPGILIYPLY